MNRGKSPSIDPTRSNIERIVNSCIKDREIIRHITDLRRIQRKALNEWMRSFDSSNIIRSENLVLLAKARMISGQSPNCEKTGTVAVPAHRVMCLNQKKQ